jgi:hypothetical protein
MRYCINALTSAMSANAMPIHGYPRTQHAGLAASHAARRSPALAATLRQVIHDIHVVDVGVVG